MNKTISINLGGMLFNLEEAAYETLSAYLQQIRSYFRDSEGRDEILGDIESRIAELFGERLKNKQVILESDVQEVIAIMGRAEEYAGEAETDDEDAAEGTPKPGTTGPRRLFRDPDDGIIAGVCSGVGHYFGIDPVWLRVAFLLAFIFGGSGLILYIVLWIAMPKATTRADKLRMQGKPVTIDTIEKGFKEEMERIKKQAGTFSKEAGSRLRDSRIGPRLAQFINELLQGISRVIRKLLKWLGRFIGFFLLFGGMVLFFAWLAVVLGAGHLISVNDTGVFSFSISSFFNAVFSSPTIASLFMAGLALVVLSPILALLLAGIRLLLFPRFSYRWPAAVNGGLFVVGLAVCVICGATLIGDFRSNGKILENVPVSQPASDTLDIRLFPESDVNFRHAVHIDHWKFYFHDNEPYMHGRVRLSVAPSDNGRVVLTVEKNANGKDKKEAIATASTIRYFMKQQGNTLLFNPYFRLDNNSKWRGQSVEFTLKLPENKFVRFDEKMRGMVNNIDLYEHPNGKTSPIYGWRKENERLECANCPGEDE